MKITVEIDGKKFDGKLPFDNAPHFETNGTVCPHCGATNIPVRGDGLHIESHDTYAADAIHYAESCMKKIGTVRVKMSTIFGLEEDERVLVHGRARVY